MMKDKLPLLTLSEDSLASGINILHFGVPTVPQAFVLWMRGHSTRKRTYT